MSKAIVLLGDLGSDHEGFPPTPVIAGSPDVLVDGKPVARVGDPLVEHSKPKHSPHPRVIAAGSSSVMINGKPAAITGSAISCGGVAIGSGSVVVGDTHVPAPFSGTVPAARRKMVGSETEAKSAQPISIATESEDLVETVTSSQGTVPVTSVTFSTVENQLSSDVHERRRQREPGFHVVRKPMSRDELVSHLYGGVSATPDNFDRLNPGLGKQLLPGEMIVVADPDSLECTARENDLMGIAARVNQEVRQLSSYQAQFIVDHYDLLELMTANAATGLGAGATMIGQQIKSINTTLKEIETLYQRTYENYGRLSVPEFFEQRQKLFEKLDFALGRMARKRLSLNDSAKLKNALGLSSKSIVHHWSEAGVGSIPGYGTHYSRAADAARFMEQGGRLFIALDAGLAGYKIYEACSFDRGDECKKVTYVESGRFVGSVVGGSVGASVTPFLCAAIGAGTGGIGGLACGIVAAGIGGAVGGKIVGDGGADAGQLIYEMRTND